LRNWIDILFVVILAEAAVRGFVKGFWVTLLSFIGTIAGLIGAYCLTGPVVRLLENQWHIVSSIERSLFASVTVLPAFNVPFGPATITNISDFVRRSPALGPLAEAAERALLDILSGRQVATAGEAVAVVFATLLVRTAVFLILVALIRVGALLLAKGLDVATRGSIPLRILGALLDACLRATWLALIVGGVVYPVIVAGDIPFFREALTSSRITPYLLDIYQAVARIGFGWIRP